MRKNKIVPVTILFILVGLIAWSVLKLKVKHTESNLDSVINLTWFYQLQGEFDLKKHIHNNKASYDLYILDLFDTNARVISKLKEAGAQVFCYMSVGTAEDWREDFELFPKDALGNEYKGWSGEYWLDINNPKVLKIMFNRINLAKSKGCDGLELDNIDEFSNDNGLGITKDQEVIYILRLIDFAKEQGLKVSQKNAPELVNILVDKVDMALLEECIEQGFCGKYQEFIDLNKPVLDVEYNLPLETTCKLASQYKVNGAIACKDLDGCFTGCWE